MMENDFPVTLTKTVSSRAVEWRLPVEQGAPLHRFDHFVQLSTDLKTQSYVVRALESDDFMVGLVGWANEKELEVDLLKSFAAWQKSKLDFAGVYTAFLLDAISEDEFVEESHKYAITVQAKCEPDKVETAEKLVSMLPFELTTADIAEYLRTEPRALLQAIAQTNNPSQKLKELLPTQTPELDDE